MLGAAMEAAHAADRGAVLLWDPRSDELKVHAHIGYSNPEIELLRLARGEQPLLWAALDGMPSLIPVSQAPGRPYDGLVEEPLPPRSAVIAPLRFRGSAIGVVVLSSTARTSAFSQADLDLLTTFATAAAGAVENARLFGEAQGKATLEERQRLARALHDSVTQSLYSLTLFAEAAKDWAAAGEMDNVKPNLDRISETAQQSLKEMRLLVYELRPSGLQTEGLVEALRRRLDAVEKRAGIETHLTATDLPLIPAVVEEALFHIAQEALNNSLKHAAALTVSVRLWADEDYAYLEVEDKGKGFDPDALTDTGGMGLISMRERAERAGGSLRLVAAPGGGTKVLAQLRISSGLGRNSQ